MSTLSSAKKKKMGRPRVDSAAVNVRLQASDISALDAYQAAAGLKSRPEAIRTILTEWLREKKS